MGNQAGIIIRNVKNGLFHSAKRLILNEVKGIECLRKQGMRSRLFTYWFSTYEYNSKYSLHTTCINDEEGIPNFAALIIRNDNPHIVEIVSEFVETAKALQQKP